MRRRWGGVEGGNVVAVADEHMTVVRTHEQIIGEDQTVDRRAGRRLDGRIEDLQLNPVEHRRHGGAGIRQHDHVLIPGGSVLERLHAQRMWCGEHIRERHAEVDARHALQLQLDLGEGGGGARISEHIQRRRGQRPLDERAVDPELQLGFVVRGWRELRCGQQRGQAAGAKRAVERGAQRGAKRGMDLAWRRGRHGRTVVTACLRVKRV